MNIMLDLILNPGVELSLLYGKCSDNPAPVSFYINDLFKGYEGFDQLYEFMRDHFLLRIKWARLCIAF